MRDRLRRVAAWFGWRNVPQLANPTPLPGEPQPPDDLDALIEATRETYGPDFDKWEAGQQLYRATLREYRHAYLTSCPDCFSDLRDEGSSWWCDFCDRSWSFTSIVLMDEGTDPRDD